MDDLTIHIDELVLDGATALDPAALAAALNTSIGFPVDPSVLAEVGAAITRILPPAGLEQSPGG